MIFQDKFNYTHYTTQKLYDGGAIYTLSMSPGSVVKGNLIHDANGYPGGIYLDEGSGGVEVSENVVYDVEEHFYYHEVGIRGRSATCNIHSHYFDVFILVVPS